MLHPNSRIMRTLLVTLVVALLVMSGSTLKCNRCINKGCYNTVETCAFGNNACISALFTRYPFNYFRRCSTMTECLLLSRTPGINAVCCHTDRCN
ncbi:cytotoxin 7-like [Electrophorus electricus]|uniref:UPAR/Ly6 domain-containing protein n=1 Tax=Electrophorus electricus TaxID=8005 RepID=A0AAY5EBJ9_ELEEL|nr:cytotoxin 7-like [Electrophorus electricus]